jgi:hypothetical protein
MTNGTYYNIINIMRKKRNLKKDFRFHDDITQSNLGLMARLKRSERFENVWFYSCNGPMVPIII